MTLSVRTASIRPIRFGTDGWREVIADGFTFERVRVVSAALARHLETAGLAGRGVAIGYDARFLSGAFARAVAEVLAGAGITVLMSDRQTPTPALAASVVDHRLGGGVMVTASHNPPEFNGLKFKPPYGGSATEVITGPIEREANRLLAEVPDGNIPRIRFEEAVRQGKVQMFDPVEPYLRRILALVDTGRIASSGLRVAADAMHGAARRVLSEALRRAGCIEVVGVREEENPGFGGVNPEPIEANLGALEQAVSQHPSVCAGFAVDGDGDRIGMVDERGRFIDAHQIFSLVLMHLVEHRGLSGEVVKTVSTTSMIDRLCARYGLPLTETPVGFKYVCQRMLEGDVLAGGEESGGIGIRGHIPERDGVLIALVVAELIAQTGAAASALVRMLAERAGPHAYGRADRKVEPAHRDAVVSRLSQELPETWSGLRVVDTRRIDGVKFHLEDGAWLMIRASGTEPLVRVYAEAPDSGEVERLLSAGQAWIAEAPGRVRE